MRTIGECPNCGKDDLLFVNAQARGTAIVFFTSDGQIDELEMNNTWFLRSRTVRCSSCKNIRRDLKYNPISREIEVVTDE